MTEPDPRAAFDDILINGVAELSISLRAVEVAAFRAHCDELLRWSPHMNLTGFGTLEEIVRQGILDSLVCSSLVPLDAKHALDVGSGAGFPSIPLSVVHPRIEFTLVEPSRKKTSFLRHVVRHLGLTNVRVLPVRVEDLLRDQRMLCAFDVAAARAVAPLEKIGGWVRPLLRVGGVFLAQANPGECSTAALIRLQGSGFEVAAESRVPVGFGKPGRRIVALRKTKHP